MASTIATTSIVGVASTWAARACWATGSALYVVVLDTGATKLRAYKSTNGTSWTEQDSANAPTQNSTTAPYSTWLAAGYIYVVRFTNTNTLRVTRFNTATDAWETTDIGAADATTAASNAHSVRIVVRSDADVILFYRNSSDSDTYHARYEGSSWTAATVATTQTSFPQDAVLAASDRADCFFFEQTSNDNSHRILKSDNTYGSLGTLDLDASANATAMRATNACLYNDGTNDRFGLLGRDSGGELDYYHGTVADSPTVTTVNAVSTSTTPHDTSCAAEDFSSKVYVCWSVEGTGVLYDVSVSLTDFTFGGDTTLVSLASGDPMPQFVTGLSALGVVYQDGTTVKVEWITAPASGDVTIAGALATATAAANAPTVVIVIPEALATGTADTLAPIPVIIIPEATATATAAALAGTIGPMLIPGALATASADASAPTPTIVIPGALATATGDALAGAIGPMLIPGALATATADAAAPTPVIIVPGALATGTADTLAPTVVIVIPGALATASADASAPTIVIVIPGVTATALADALAAAIDTGTGPITEILAVTATATADANAPTLIIIIPGALATSTADAPAPTPTIAVPGALATGTGDALAPTPTIAVPESTATATADATAPTPTIIIPGALATATGQSDSPELAIVVPGVLATATAGATAPRIFAFILTRIGGQAVLIPVVVATPTGGPVLIRGQAALVPVAVATPSDSATTLRGTAELRPALEGRASLEAV